MNQLEDLLQQCTVKLSLSGQPDWGTGFFVAPGLILTCAHVVRKVTDLQVTVSCPAWQQPLSAVVKAKAEDGKTLDLALLELSQPLAPHPCVLLDEEPVAIGQALYSYGYLESYANAAPVRPVNEGLTGDTPPLLKLQGAQIQWGISGAALLNLKTGKVCGIVKETRDRSFDLGGGAIPTHVILEQFPELRELQQAFHRSDRQWVNLIAQPIIDSSIEKNQAQPQVSNNRSFFVLNLFTPNFSKSEQLSSHEKNRYRQALLDRVRKSWIKGILEQSLFNQVQIELGLERFVNTLSLDYEISEQSRQRLPKEAKISEEFFDQLGLGRSLLILGESGVGKTTILLELTRDLLSRAEQDINLPIPVVFSLSSWSRQPLADWLVKELNKPSPYGLSPSLNKIWLGEQRLFLLLDGLNEISSKQNQELCIEAINDFKRQYALVDIVICNRIDRHERLTTQLDFPHDKVFINSLSLEQVKSYLNQVTGLEGIRSALYTDPILQTIARTPLMLNVMILAYRGKHVEELPCLSLEERRELLWNNYIQEMWKRGKKSAYYPKNQATNWLIWLAKKMQNSSNVFLIEELQSNCLHNSKQRKIYHFLFLYVCIALIPLALFFLIAIFAIPNFLDFGNLISCAVSILIITLFLVSSVYGEEGSNFERQGGYEIFYKIEPVEVLIWSPKEVGRWLVDGLIHPFRIRDQYHVFRGSYIPSDQYILTHPILMTLLYTVTLPILLPFIWTIAIAVSPFMGISTSKSERKIEPNQGIWRSLNNSIIGGLVGGLTGVLVGQCLVLSFLCIVYIGDLLNSANEIVGFININIFVKAGLICSLIGLYLGWLFYGGASAIQHFILRLILNKTGKIPYNYSRFLDWATERSFLQKVGGGYTFVHSSLMEHFAQMKQDSQNF